MKIHQVVVRDTLRRRRRLLFTALGVAIGVAAVVAVLTVANAGEKRIYSEIDKYGPNMMVTPAIAVQLAYSRRPATTPAITAAMKVAPNTMG